MVKLTLVSLIFKKISCLFITKGADLALHAILLSTSFIVTLLASPNCIAQVISVKGTKRTFNADSVGCFVNIVALMVARAANLFLLP